MENIRIVEFRLFPTEKVADFAYSVLRSVGIQDDKYPEIKKETTSQYILENYTGRSDFWLALRNETLIGTIALREVDINTAELKRMFVSPELHGTGVGQNLLDTLLAFARARGYKKIVLDTDKLMTRAHRFYEKNGFHRTREHLDYLTYELTL